MARVLHLVKGADAALALEVVAQQQAAGDALTLVLLPGATLTPPAGVTVRRVPDDLSWEQLLEEIFQADQVITW
jgi:hypothetical protein